MEPATPRLPVRTDRDDDRLPELFERGLRGADGDVLNIFGTLAHHPDLLRRWLVFATHVLAKTTLSARDRELLILRTSFRCGSRYEWSHHVVIARGCGITDDEIAAVQVGPGADAWSDHERALLTAADELHDDSTLSDATWSALSAAASVEQLLDVIATVGNYHLVAMFLNATGVVLDPGVPDAWPAGVPSA